jgi:hypothetical protein
MGGADYRRPTSETHSPAAHRGVAQKAERLVWDQKAAGSKPASPTMLKLKFRTDLGRITKRQQNVITDVANWLRKHYKVRHALPVIVVPHPVVGEPPDIGFGVFWHHAGGRPTIAMGVGAYRHVLKDDSREAADDFLVSTLLHEFIHYLQFRDTGETTERGVAVRTNGMLMRYRGLK